MDGHAIFRPRSYGWPPAEARKVSSFERKEREGRDRAGHALRAATRLTPALFSTVVTGACARVSVPMRASHTERLAQLILSEAWIDAALFVVELELPQWHVRRLVLDGGEWICTLSRHPGLPIELDDAAEGRHAAVPIAILLSLVEAKCLMAATESAGPRSLQREGPPAACACCCDNFG